MAYERILVPLDGSELAEGALRYADLIPASRLRLLVVEPVVLAAARRRDALEPLPPWGSWRFATPADYLEIVGAPLRRPGREVEVLVTPGDPGERIVAAVADADLIVMTTRGRGAGGRAIFGSVADHVTRRASVPTLLIRAGHPTSAAAVLRIVVPLDGSPRAKEALPTATVLAAAFGVPLHLVRAVDPATTLATSSALEDEARAYLEQQARRLGALAIGTTDEVRVGTVTDQVLDTLQPGDLVVMATRGRSGLRRALLGSVSTAVVRRASVPVVLIRAEPGEMAPSLDAAGRPTGDGG